MSDPISVQPLTEHPDEIESKSRKAGKKLQSRKTEKLKKIFLKVRHEIKKYRKKRKKPDPLAMPEYVTLRRPAASIRVRIVPNLIARITESLLVTPLPANQGLFFVGTGKISTKGQENPVDIIFVDDDAYIISIEKRVPPGSQLNQAAAVGVLLLSAGTARYLRLKRDEQLKRFASVLSRRSRSARRRYEILREHAKNKDHFDSPY